MVSKTEDSQFVATGGDVESGKNFGFYTDPSEDSDEGEQLDYGVNVQGNVCGVYAESLGTPRLLEDREPRALQKHQFVGIYSIGQSYGVIAEGFTGNGVTGISAWEVGAGVQRTGTNNNVGVIGLNMQVDDDSMPGTVMGNGYGVLGLSGTGGIGIRCVTRKTIDPKTPLDTSRGIENFYNQETDEIISDGIGVEGISGGIGVHGKSLSKPGSNHEVRRMPGVFGESTTGSGVAGESQTGPGVSGHSIKGRGGVFSSTDIAQLQLTPVPAHHSKPAPLPADGMPGDFFVRYLPEPVLTPDGHSTIQLRAELWFCVVAAFDSNPVEWKQIA